MMFAARNGIWFGALVEDRGDPVNRGLKFHGLSEGVGVLRPSRTGGS
jgi:hypothetical protein